MKTFYDIIKDVSNLRWSIVDPEPDSFAEVQKSVKLAVQQAHSFIWNLDDFPFKNKKDAIAFSAGLDTVLAPKGNVTKVWIDGTSSELEGITPEAADMLPQKSGTPQYFWIEFTDQGAALKVYPTPDKDTVILVRYITNYKAQGQDGKLKANLEDVDDILNLPNDQTVEDLYLQCLNTKSMEYLVADNTDENYEPYKAEFWEAYRALLKLTGRKVETRLII